MKRSERSTARQVALVREIRRLHARREPLNLAAVKKHHPELVREVFAIRPFWGWIQALRDAGLDYGGINTELDDIIDCRICGRSFLRLQNHLKLHRISAAAYRNKFQAETHSELERAHDQCRIHSRQQSRRRLAMWDSPWCEEIVLDRMAEYHRQRVPLHYSAMEKREYPLVSRASLYFGSWDAALRRIGLDPAKVRRLSPSGAVHYPTAGSVIRAIRRRHKEGLPLNTSALTQTLRTHPHRDEPLFDRGVHFFGSWDEAIREAGLPRQRLLRRPCYTTPEAVLEEIQRRHRQGSPLHAVALTEGPKAERDRILYRYGARFFGGWNQAVAKAGLPPQAIRSTGGRYPTGPSVIAEIQRRLKAGLPVHNYQLHTGVNKNPALLKCGIRHFGGWAQALQAAKVSSPYRKLGPLIMQALEAAGSNGLSEKEIAVRIAGNQASVHGWFYRAGKKLPRLCKIAPATYAYTTEKCNI